MKKNKKTPPNSITLDFGIGDRRIYVCWGKDEESMRFYANARNAPEIFLTGCNGMTSDNKIWLIEPDDMPCLAHELLHAINNACKEMGIEYENELFAYKLSDLMEQYINKRKKLLENNNKIVDKEKPTETTDISV